MGPEAEQYDYTALRDLSQQGITDRLADIGFTLEDAALLRRADQTLTALTDNRWGSLFDGIEAMGDELQAPATLRAALRQFLRELTLCDFEVERLSTDLQVWVQLQRMGLGVDWPATLLSRYLTAMSELCGGFRGDASFTAERVMIALQKLVMFHLGFISQAFVGEERAAYYYQAYHDADSGLPNQHLFQRQLKEALRGNGRDEFLLAVIRIQIVASHRLLGYPGYPSVEQLIAAVAARLTEAIRPIDVLAHLNKTELALMLPQLKSEGQMLLAVNKLLRTLEPPFVLGEIEVAVRPLLGAALAPKHANEAEVLFRLAEIARQAAAISADGYAIYSETLDADERLQRSLEIELRTALRENEFLLYFQPQLDLGPGTIRSAEALLRWKNRRGDFVPPNIIVSVAEQCGLMSELTRWVINTAVRHCSEFRRNQIDVAVSVNLSATDLQTSELVESIEQCLRAWNVPADRLILEITEGSMIRDMDQVLSVMQRLKEVGIELSIDDFGTGYSSLAYLKRLPIHELKIDQIFVRHMLKVKEDERIVRTIIDLAHNLDLRVVAEGVEDPETLNALKQLDCDTIQGYVVSRPIPPAEFQRWWDARGAA